MTLSRLTIVLLLTFAAFGCERGKAGTETDNPFHESSEPETPPPPYESPIRFNPDEPGVPGCPVPNDDTGPARGPYWALADDALLVGAERDQLTVIDTSVPSAPVRVSVTPMRGFVWALAAVGTDVAVVVEEAPELASDELPAPEALAQQLRLVHFDVSDPSEPRRVGSRDLDGEFWRLVERDGALWLMAATLSEGAANSCQFPWQGCGYRNRVELRVQGYRFSDGGFAELDSARAPMSQRAWAGQDGFVSAQTVEGEAAALHIVRFDGDALLQSELRALEGEPDLVLPAQFTPVGLVGAQLYYFTGEGSEPATSATLHTVDVSESLAVETSRVENIPGAPRYGVAFAEQRVIVGSEDLQRSAWVIDATASDTPVVTVLPAGVALAWPLPDDSAATPRLLGWGDVDGSGQLSVGIVGALGLERALRTPFPTPAYFSNEDQPLFPPALRVNGDRVAFVHHEYEPYRRISRVSVLDPSADPLTLSTTTDALFADELLLTTDFVYAPDFRGISAIPTGASPAAAVLVDFGYEEQLDVLPVGTGQAALVIDVEGRRELVLTESNGVERVRIELPETAERLLPVGEHVAVLLEHEGSNDCEQSGGVDCDEHGLWLVDPRDTPEVVGTAEWPLATFESSRGTSAFGSYMHAPLRLANGDWVFLQEESVTCTLITECDALGIAARPLSEANVVFAMPAPCPDSVEDCPPPPPAPEVYGKSARANLYRLDASDPSRPKFVALGSSELELQESSFAEPRAAGNWVLLTRRELPSQGATARFMLERFDGTVDAAPDGVASLNIPGYAIGMADEKTLFTVEPLPPGESGATLYRLRVTEQGAYVEASRVLPGRYGDVRIAGDFAYHLGKGADGCSSGQLQPIALDNVGTELAKVALPGSEWDLLLATPSQMLLRGPNYAGCALFNLSRGAPTLATYYPACAGVPRVIDGQPWSIPE